MARFSGGVGYGTQVESAPGVWENVIVEFTYYGDVQRNSRRTTDVGQINTELSVGHTISIVADAYARANFLNIKYVKWSGKVWTVPEIQVQPPRLLLTLGEVYNGEQATTA